MLAALVQHAPECFQDVLLPLTSHVVRGVAYPNIALRHKAAWSLAEIASVKVGGPSPFFFSAVEFGRSNLLPPSPLRITSRLLFTFTANKSLSSHLSR